MKILYHQQHQDKYFNYTALKQKKDDGSYLYFCKCDDDCEPVRRYVLFKSQTDIFHPNFKAPLYSNQYYDVNCFDRLDEF